MTDATDSTTDDVLFTIEYDGGKLVLGTTVEGYDVEVEIHRDVLARKLRNLEGQHAETINRDGTDWVASHLQHLVTMDLEPTDEKWEELLEIEASDDDDGDTDGDPILGRFS